MNVYDFDNTIYRGDSSIDFFLFCLYRKPLLALQLPVQILSFILIKTELLNIKRGKEMFFSFLKWIKNPDKEVSLFWIKHKNKICQWYLLRKNNDDLIISASPYFLLKPIVVDDMKLSLIATDIDKNSGKINGDNCKAEEKLKQFHIKYGNSIINEFYSDSISDAPLAEYADDAFLINWKKDTKPELIHWNSQ